MAVVRITDLAAAGALSGTEMIEVSQLSETVTITGLTISAAAADGSFSDSANGFVTAGFAEGDRVMISGFAEAANNIYAATLGAVTADKIVIVGDEGAAIVDEAAGPEVTISKWATRRASAQDIASLGGGGDVEEAPEDGQLYARRDAAWEAFTPGGGGSGTVVVAPVAGTAYDLLNADKGKYLRLTDAAAKTVTVRPNATEALDDNAEWHFRNTGAGDATFVPGSGVTINAPAGGSLVIPQGGTVTLKRVAVDEFDLIGQTVAI